MFPPNLSILFCFYFLYFLIFLICPRFVCFPQCVNFTFMFFLICYFCDMHFFGRHHLCGICEVEVNSITLPSDQSISGGFSRGLAVLLTARSGGYLPSRGASQGGYGLPSVGLARVYRDGARFRASEISSPAHRCSLYMSSNR